MESLKHHFKGLWPAMFTPMNLNGSVNEVELEKLIEFLIGDQSDGLYILGSTGQGFLLNETERKRFAAVTLEIVNRRIPVIVQVGAISTDESMRLAKDAAQKGAQAISAVGPIYYGSTPVMAFEHYKKIAGASDLPFIPYQIGHAANKTLVDKLRSIPNIIGMKLTTGNLLEISSIYHQTEGKWQLFSGSDELMCHAALCGTAGAIGSTYNISPFLFKEVRRRFLNGEVSMAHTFMLEFQKIIELILPCIWPFYKQVMLLKHNIDIGMPRSPLLSPTLKWTDQEVLHMIDKLEEIAKEEIIQHKHLKNEAKIY